jgi:predicted O-methyltransferase YrrM
VDPATGSRPQRIQSPRNRTGTGQERLISGNGQPGWAFAEAFVAEDEALLRARQRARHAGVRAVSPGTGAALRMLAATVGARVVVEIGTGLGVSGVHLLRGMRADGVLTTVDTEPDRQQLAREAFREAGFAGNRARCIPGRAADVLPRLADGGYDLVFCDGDRSEYVRYLAESLRLLRPGGLVCFEGVFARGRSMDAAFQEIEVQELREVMRAARDDDALVPVLLPTGDGLLCAVKRS